MAFKMRHLIHTLLMLVCASMVTSCSNDGANQILTVNFDNSYGSQKTELVQPDQATRVNRLNAKRASFDVTAVVTYKGTKTLEYIWGIDNSDSAVEYSIQSDPVNPNHARITLTYSYPLSATAFDGTLPIRLVVKENGGTFSDSDVMYVDVSIFGGTNG